MTGAFLRVKRDEVWQPVEVEFLTQEELREHFLNRTPEELVRWIAMLCKVLREVAE